LGHINKIAHPELITENNSKLLTERKKTFFLSTESTNINIISPNLHMTLSIENVGQTTTIENLTNTKTPQIRSLNKPLHHWTKKNKKL
jgi:hypothetical protein